MRKTLDLTPVEQLQLHFRLRSHGISVGLATVSLLMLAVSDRMPMWAGMIYALMGPLHAWNGYSAGKAQAALAKQAEQT